MAKQLYRYFRIDRLKGLREQRSMSYEDLGVLIGKTGRSIMNWEGGKTAPNIWDMQNIAQVFALDLKWFLSPSPTNGDAPPPTESNT